jgi:hypothetical protein
VNAEVLHSVVAKIVNDQLETDIVSQLEQLRSEIQRTMTQPTEVNYAAIATRKQRIAEGLKASLWHTFSEAEKTYVSELKLDELVGPGLEQSISLVLGGGQATISESHQGALNLKTRLDSLAAHAANVRAAFEYFDLAEDTPEKNAPEIGVLIPRTSKTQELEQFIRELKDINFLLRTFSELTNGHVGSIKVRKIASSNFLLDLVPETSTAVLALAGALHLLLSCYEKVLGIKKISAETKKLNAPDSVTDVIDTWATNTVATEIKNVAKDLVKKHLKDTAPERRHEIENALIQSLNKTMTKIDQGHGYQVRVSVDTVSDEATVGDSVTNSDDSINQQIAKLAPLIQFQRPSGPPILSLPAVEDESPMDAIPAQESTNPSKKSAKKRNSRKRLPKTDGIVSE